MTESSSKKTFNANLSQYKLDGKISKDANCSIYKIKDKNQNTYSAKVIKNKLDAEVFKDYIERLKLYQQISNPAFLNIHGISKTDFDGRSHLTVITDYYNNQNLQDIFELEYQKKGLEDWNSTKKYIIFLGTALAMKELHDKNITYGQLNPGNILLNKKYYPQINLSKIPIDANEGYNYKFRIYVAPELVDESDQTPAADVFSFGFIAYTLFTGKLPNIHSKVQLRGSIKVERPNTKIIKDIQLLEFLNSCWHEVPSERQQFAEIVSDLLRGKYQTAFPDININEVTEYLHNFFKTKKDDEEEEEAEPFNLKPVSITFSNSEDGMNCVLEIYAYQTVSDVIEVIKKENKYNFDVYLTFEGEKLRKKDYLVDIVGDTIDFVEVVPIISEEPPNDSQKVVKETKTKKEAKTEETYTWKVSNKDQSSTNRETFTFPLSFTFGDAIKEIEKMYEFKYMIRIVEVKDKKGKKVDQKANIYKMCREKDTEIMVFKKDISYVFQNEDDTDDGSFEFHYSDEIKSVAQYLSLDEESKSISFNEKRSKETFKYTSKLEFMYKNVVYPGNTKFKSLHYNYHDNEPIIVSYSVPKYFLYSPTSIERIKAEKEKITLGEIKQTIQNRDNVNNKKRTNKKVKQKANNNTNGFADNYANNNNNAIEKNEDLGTHFIIYKNFERIDNDKCENEGEKIEIDKNTIIDCFGYNKKICFKFDLLNEKISDYYYYTNESDEELTIEEIKSFLVSRISPYPKRSFSPKKIILRYKDKVIGKDTYFFKDIKYKEGEFISVSICKRTFHVQVDGELKEIEIEDRDFIVSDLLREISKDKQYTLTFNDNDLNGTDRLKDIFTNEKEFITAEQDDSPILTYEGEDYYLNNKKIDVKNVESLRNTIKADFEIDVDNCDLKYKNKSIQLKDFKNLPNACKVECIYKGRSIYNNFKKDKYKNVFYSDQTISDVRKYAIAIMRNRSPCCIKSGDKYLFGQTKLYTIIEPIEIIKMKQPSYNKNFYTTTTTGRLYKRTTRNLIAYQEFGVNAKVLEVKKFINQKITTKPFVITSDDVILSDFDKIHEFGEEIDIKMNDISYNKTVSFILHNNSGKTKEVSLKYSKIIKNFEYKAQLQLREQQNYIFITQGKLFIDHYDTLEILNKVKEEDRIVYTYPYSMLVNFEYNQGDRDSEDDVDETDLFDKTATSVMRVEREKVKIDKITVLNIDNYEKEDIFEGKLEFPYHEKKGPKTVIDLRDKIAQKLGIRDTDKISLFILFTIQSNQTTDFTLLSDDEKIIQILSDNPGKYISFKILTNDSHSLPLKTIRRYKKYCNKAGVNLTDQQIKEIYIKTDHNFYWCINTFYYLAEKNE